MSDAMTLFSQALEQLRLAAVNVPGLTELATFPFLFRPLVMVVLLGVVAGVIGVGIAIVVVRSLPLETMGIALSDTPAFPVGAAIAGVAISSSIGALCGIIPALAAVRIKPIDAIRY